MTCNFCPQQSATILVVRYSPQELCQRNSKVYDSLSIRCWAQHIPKFKTIRMAETVDLLRKNDSNGCADWLEKNFTPDHPDAG